MISIPIRLASPAVAEQALRPFASHVLLQPSLGVLYWLHSRHIGATPALTIDLIRFTQGHKDLNFWAGLRQRLMQELRRGGQTNWESAPGTSYVGMQGWGNPAFVISRIAAPLLYKACTQIGYTVVFAEDSVATEVSWPEYEKYARQLEQTLLQLFSAQTPPQADTFARQMKFWAATLARHTEVREAHLHQTQGKAAQQTSLPDLNSTAASFLFDLVPDPQMLALARTQQPKLRQPPDFLTRLRNPEGGITGIELSHQESDISSMLISELANPPVLMADKLLNSGFLIKKRTPRRRPYRHLLLASFMVPEVQAQVTGDFMRACWAEFAMRLGYQLVQAGLVQTDLVWVEGTHQAEAQAVALTLEDLNQDVTGNATRFDKRRLLNFLNALKALPDFGNQRAVGLPLTLPAQPTHEAEDGLEAWEHRSLSWMEAAWQAVAQQMNGLSADDYLAFQIMVHLPHQPGQGELKKAFGLFMAQLRSVIAANEHPYVGLSVTWGPSLASTIDAVWQWGTYSPRTGLATFETSKGESMIAGLLIRAWLEQANREALGGG